MPFARATGMGSTFDCADHSNSVCFLVRSTISWPVMVGTVVTVVIRCSGLTRRLSGNLRAAWACESIRLHTTLGNAGQSSFEHIQPFIHLRVGDNQRHEQANHVAVRTGGDRDAVMLVTVL